MTTEQKLKRMEKYLYELNDQLHVVLNNLELDNFTVEAQDSINISAEVKETVTKDLTDDIESLKQAIIKTAEEINLDLETRTSELTGSLEVLSNQYGTYNEEYFRQTVENALSTTELFVKTTDYNDQVQSTAAYIVTGEISEQTGQNGDHYGIVIGEVGGNGLKVAIESGKMSFYEGTKEVAYISGEELVINKVKIEEYIYFGKYRIEVVNGIAFNWEG